MALYQGADREKILVEGAKREGQFIFIHIAYVVSHSREKDFERKISVRQNFRVAQRLQERHPKSARGSKIRPNPCRRRGNDRRRHGSRETGRPIPGVLFSRSTLPTRTSSSREEKTGSSTCRTGKRTIALDSTPHCLSTAAAPRNFKDLVDPKWKGGDGDHQHDHRSALDPVMHWSLWDASIWIRWPNKRSSPGYGAPAALINLVASGEVPHCRRRSSMPTSLSQSKRERQSNRRPLEPVVPTVGSSALIAKAPNPHSALLFIDFLLSREGQQLIMKGGHSGRQTRISAPWSKSLRRLTWTKSTSLEESE